MGGVAADSDAGAPAPPPRTPLPASPPAACGASTSASAAALRGLCNDVQAGRQHSYLYNVNLGGGLALPLRLPSAREAAAPANGGGAHGVLPKRPSRAYLEAGTTLREEAARLMKLAGPLFIEGVTNIGTQLVATTCVARLGGGPLALSALVLAQTQLNFGYSVICGIAAAMETCCGQAFGAGQYALLGLVLQCAQALCLLIAVPTAALWASGFAGPLLTALGQVPEVAAQAGVLLRRAWPVLPLLAISETTGQYLLAQGVAAPASVAGLLMLALAPPAYWGLSSWLGWLTGVPAAQVSLQLVAVAVLTLWCVRRDARIAATAPERATWNGFSLESLKGLPTYTRFAVPAAAMLCLEWWIWEVVVFLTGLLPHHAEEQLGAIGFVMQISILTWTLSYSVGTGAATRIANSLGAGHAANARRIFRLACCLLLVVNAAVATTLWLARRRLSALLTPDEAVAREIMRILPAAILGVLGDGQVAVLGGLLRAAGRQSTGALIHAATYWLVGLPAGYTLGFVFDWGAKGLWLGVASATALQAATLHSWVALRLDWGAEVKRSEATIGALLDSHAIADLGEATDFEESEFGGSEGGGDLEAVVDGARRGSELARPLLSPGGGKRP